VSTVDLHTEAVAQQGDLQAALRAIGWPCVNDPAAGKRAAVTRVSGLAMARTRLALRLPTAAPDARAKSDGLVLDLCDATRGDHSCTVAVALEEGWVTVVATAPEPKKFATVRDSEAAFYGQRAGAAQAAFYGPSTASFGGLELACEGVMTPRAASETLVNAAFAFAAATSAAATSPASFRVLDLGTGSGCLLLALLDRIRRQLPLLAASGVGVDNAARALQVATANAAALSTATASRGGDCEASRKRPRRSEEMSLAVAPLSARFCLGTFKEFSAAPPFHVCVCNPPYLDPRTAALDASARAADPASSVFAADGGMRAYTDLAANPALFARGGGAASFGRLLSADGVLLVEVPHGRAAKVAACLLGSASQNSGLEVGLLRDARGLERCLVIARRAAHGSRGVLSLLGAEQIVL
jgi:release factor glutamine methyltransferase